MTGAISRDDRYRLLHGYTQRVATLVEKATASGKALRLKGADRELRLDATEAEMVWKALAHDDDVADLTALMIGETIAYRLKVTADLRSHGSAEEVDAETRQAKTECLELDLAIGESLATDYDVVIDQLFAINQRDQAHRLGEFRIALRHDMERIGRERTGIDEAPGGETEATAAAVPHPPVADADEYRTPLSENGPATVPATAPETVPETVPASEAARHGVDQPHEEPTLASRRHLSKLRRERQQQQATQRRRRQPRLLLAVLGILLAVLLGRLAISLVPGLRAPDVKLLTIDDFSDIEVIEQIAARPPSLFVRVKGKSWEKLDRQQQRRVVTRIGKVLQQEKYNGAKIRDEQGILLGEWIRGVGVFVYPE